MPDTTTTQPSNSFQVRIINSHDSVDYTGLKAVIIQLDGSEKSVIQQAFAHGMVVHVYYELTNKSTPQDLTKELTADGINKQAFVFLKFNPDLSGDWPTMLTQYMRELRKVGRNYVGVIANGADLGMKFFQSNLREFQIYRISITDKQPAVIDADAWTPDGKKVDDLEGSLEHNYAQSKQATGRPYWGMGYDTQRGGGRTYVFSPDGVNQYALWTTDGLNLAPYGDQIYSLIKGQTSKYVDNMVDAAVAKGNAEIAEANKKFATIDQLTRESKAYQVADAAINKSLNDAVKRIADNQKLANDALNGNLQLDKDIKATNDDLTATKLDLDKTKTDLAGTKADLQTTQKSLAADHTTLESLSDTAKSQGKTLVELQKTTDGITTDVADTKGNVTKLTETATTLTNEMTDAQGDITKLQQRADGYDANFTNTKGDIDSLKLRATGLETDMTNAKGDIGKLQSRADGLDAEYTNAAGDITKLKARADGFDTALTDAKGNIQKLQVSSQSFSDELKTANGNIAKIKATADQASAQYGDLSATQDKTAKQLDSLQNTVTLTRKSLDQKADEVSVDKVKSDVQHNQELIDANTKAIATRVSSTDVTKMLNGYAKLTDLSTQFQQTKEAIAESASKVTKDADGKINAEAAARVTAYDSISNQVDDANNNISSLNQRANAMQLKVEGDVLAQYSDVFDPGSSSSSPITLSNISKVKAGDKVTISFEYQLQNNDFNFLPVFEGTPNYPFGEFNAKNWIKGKADGEWHSYTKTVEATAEWTSGTASQVNFQVSSWGTLLIMNFRMSYGGVYSAISMTEDELNLRVAKGNVISQINLEAADPSSPNQTGGLIEIANGHGHLHLAADTVSFSGNAFIPGAYVKDLSASKLKFYGKDGSYEQISGSTDDYDQDSDHKTIVAEYKGGLEFHAAGAADNSTFLSLHDNFARLVTARRIDLDSNSDYYRDKSASIQYTGLWVGKTDAVYNQVNEKGDTAGVYLHEYTGSQYGNDDGFRLTIHDGTPEDRRADPNLADGITVYTNTRLETKASNVEIAIGQDDLYWNTSVVKDINVTSNDDLKKSIIIANRWNPNQTIGVYVGLAGWLGVAGWINCMGLTKTSRLSAKTNIQSLDSEAALDKVLSTDIKQFQYKGEMPQGKHKLHAGAIVDDVNQVSKYYTPSEFISEDRKGVEVDTMVAYLFAAMKEQQKQIESLKEQINHGK